MSPLVRRVAALVLAPLLLVGCGTTPGAGQGRQKVVVFAAASLTAAFKEIAAHSPELDIAFTFDGSPTLVEQLSARPDVADVIATADEPTMRKAADAALLKGSPTIFATNTAVMIVPRGNPGKVTGLDDSLHGKKLVVCAPVVPCGAAARTIARSAGYTLKPVSEEQKVTDVVGKVTSGEADAGVVFSTDAKAAGDKVVTIQLPGADQAVSRYPLGIAAKAPHPDGAAAFATIVTGERGRAILASYGFSLP